VASIDLALRLRLDGLQLELKGNGCAHFIADIGVPGRYGSRFLTPGAGSRGQNEPR
jgi:hypothetical protein